jgi:mono/diheme cytochrome c family protein
MVTDWDSVIAAITCMQIQNGKGQMPAWDGTLDDEEIEAVANYVYATAGANAW